MQPVPLFLILFCIRNTVHAFRVYPANYTVTFPSDSRRFGKPSYSTVFEKSFKNVLSRKKRGFVFYEGSVVVITDVVAKAILTTSPRGLIHSNEVDLFFDVPLLVQGWQQPIDDYVNRIRAQNKIDDKTIKENEVLQNIGVVNVSAIPLDQFDKMPYARPLWREHPLKYETNRKDVWSLDRKNFEAGYRKPAAYNTSPRRNYYPNSQRRNYVQARPQSRNSASNQSYQRSSAQSYRTRPSYSARQQSNKKTPSWHHHREYRERRDIYQHLENFGKALGTNLRKCILRAICEMKSELMPEGQSFINDVARILFTVPTDHDNHGDEFTQMALESNVDCVRRFVVSCPYSPMEYFLKNFRAKVRKPVEEPTAREIMNSIIYA